MFLSLFALAPLTGLRYLDNGHVRLGVDLSKGGAIVYLSKEGGPNIVNDSDLGRQIQMSYYSGPVPYEPNGKKAAKAWTFIGWNPIQTGDYYGHSSRTLEYQGDATSCHLKCIPMHWPLNNVPGECTFESWITLNGTAVEVHNRINNNRPDHTQYPARGQELPAVYTNGPWYRLMSYTGDAPFTGAPPTELTNKLPKPTFPWVGFNATESWAALVDKNGDGLGVIEPGIVQFSGGFFGTPGAGGPTDSPTGYIAPNAVEIMDWNIVYDDSYDLVVGNLKEIRRYADLHVPKPHPPTYRFTTDRQHWSYVNCQDAGWPIRGELDISMAKNDPQLIGPRGIWEASDAPYFVLEAAAKTHSPDAQLFWSRIDAPGFSEAKSAHFKLTTDGRFHRYAINLGSEPEYRGSITQVRFDPEPSGAAGDHLRIRSIHFVH